MESDGYFGGRGREAYANNAVRPSVASVVGLLYSSHLLTKHYPHG